MTITGAAVQDMMRKPTSSQKMLTPAAMEDPIIAPITIWVIDVGILKYSTMPATASAARTAGKGYTMGAMPLPTVFMIVPPRKKAPMKVKATARRIVFFMLNILDP